MTRNDLRNRYPLHNQALQHRRLAIPPTRTTRQQWLYKLGYWLVTGTACLALGCCIALVILGWLEQVP